MMDIMFEKHRIVYVVNESENDIYVLALRYHYEKQ